MRKTLALRKTLATCTAALVLLLSVATAAPAHADHRSWVIGSAFRIGHFNLNVAFRDFDRHHRPVYYYRVHDRFPYRNFPCTSRCFREGSYYYHEAHCPAVGRHFDAYHHDQHEVFYRYAPRPRGSSYGGYDDRDYGRGDRNDDSYYGGGDYDRSPRDRHYRRPAPPRHRHGQYCPYPH